MPTTHAVPEVEKEVVLVNKEGQERLAHVEKKDETNKNYYVHYIHEDKRMDEWVPAETCSAVQGSSLERKKRKRSDPSSSSPVRANSPDHETSGAFPSSEPTEPHTEDPTMTLIEDEYDLAQHKKITAARNFDDVYFGEWRIQTWYYSPYPLTDHLLEEKDTPTDSSIPTDVVRPAGRSRNRAADLFAGLLNRPSGAEIPNLWVCDRCLKYFSDAMPWELHSKDCSPENPPGELVYKRGAHAIRELDGAQHKLYCQNLSLFGKLFIDVKTLYFDTDNFMFYVVTDHLSNREHLVGFFSKEKHSFDDYNLACIMTLPHYQRKGFGMLMIEFSYELSRRAGKVGTPERPLSDLGLRSYLAYWVATVIRFFRHVLSALPPAAAGLIVRNDGNFPDLREPTPGYQIIDPVHNIPGKKKKARTLPPTDAQVTPFDVMDATAFPKMRVYETTMDPEDGSGKTHVSINCSLVEIAKACNLRVDDTAFALNESGLLTKHVTENGTERIVITRRHVEQVARERRVKPMCMDLRYVCIGTPPREL